MEDTPHPNVPEELERTTDLREYAVGMTRLVVGYADALETCNADKAALREWYLRMNDERAGQ